jgi:hypothetical protein
MKNRIDCAHGSDQVKEIGIHMNDLRKFYLGPGETLLIEYDRIKTPPSELHAAMDTVAKLFPKNKVLFCPSNYRITNLSPGTKIPLKKRWWHMFTNPTAEGQPF